MWPQTFNTLIFFGCVVNTYLYILINKTAHFLTKIWSPHNKFLKFVFHNYCMDFASKLFLLLIKKVWFLNNTSSFWFHVFNLINTLREIVEGTFINTFENTFVDSAFVTKTKGMFSTTCLYHNKPPVHKFNLETFILNHFWLNLNGLPKYKSLSLLVKRSHSVNIYNVHISSSCRKPQNNQSWPTYSIINTQRGNIWKWLKAWNLAGSHFVQQISFRDELITVVTILWNLLTVQIVFCSTLYIYL